MSTSDPSGAAEENLYQRLGVHPVINAAGTFTQFGGSLMPPAVLAARAAAAKSFVDLNELQDAVGRNLAALLQVPAALVTAGAASSLVLGTAAAISLRQPDYIQRNAETAWEVLRQTAHRNAYDRQIEMCGVRLVDVETVPDALRAISERTVLMLSYNLYEPLGQIRHAQWLALAADFAIPTLLDAAADIPPVENLWKFSQMGYDMVAFSGGKAIRGPQSSGLLLGRADLIAAARQNAVPNEGTVGRVAKVSKEDIVGLWRAVELFVSSGDELFQYCETQLTIIEALLQPVPTLTTRRIVPPVANHFPHLLLEWDERQLGITRDELKIRLTEGTPAIVTGRVPETGSEGFLISVVNLQAEEASVVGHRLTQILLTGN